MLPRDIEAMLPLELPAVHMELDKPTTGIMHIVETKSGVPRKPGTIWTQFVPNTRSLDFRSSQMKEGPITHVFPAVPKDLSHHTYTAEEIARSTKKLANDYVLACSFAPLSSEWTLFTCMIHEAKVLVEIQTGLKLGNTHHPNLVYFVDLVKVELGADEILDEDQAKDKERGHELVLGLKLINYTGFRLRAEFIRRFLGKTLSAQERWNIKQGVRNALDDLHRLGLAYNDLNPETIFVGEGSEGTPVLSDYHSCARFDEALVNPFLRPRGYESTTWKASEDLRTVSKKQHDEEDYQKLCQWLDTLNPRP